jgi:pyruvate dehydrogenase E2 component (dihydrolipoamide acetyltransferase)
MQETKHPMSGSIVMPQLGLTMTEGTISEWLKKPGDFIRKNEPVLTISTDKVEMEVESLVEGKLGKIIVQVGETVPVGAILAHLETGAKDVAAEVSKQPSTESQREKAAETKSTAEVPIPPVEVAKFQKSDRLPVSPRAKRLAKELGVDPATLKGSGNNGEIVEEDIRNAAPSQNKAVHSKSADLGLRKRQLIAERLTRSIQTVPTFSVSAEANAEKLLDLYEDLRSSAKEKTKITITDLLLSIFADSLKHNRDLCTTWENNAPKENPSIDVGLAVATPEGVVAPILRKVDTFDISHIAAMRNEIAEKARQGRLSLPELEGGITTLSNLGMYRVDHFEALISPGQSSILAVGSIRKRPWAAKTIVIKPTIILNLTVDHRVADGAVAANFLGVLIEKIEEPAGISPKPALPKKSTSGRGKRG